MGPKLCRPCQRQSGQLNSAGSILDRVISQSSNEDQCLLYKLANYKKGGELIDAYYSGGTLEVEKLIREQFGQLMYLDGKGQVINRSEYLRWKFRDHDQVVLPIEASLSRFDPLSQWVDHDACWQMQYRGSLGETLLHVLIICDSKIHTKLARILIKCFPKLAVDVVEGEEYLGASALHLAIAYFNNELVQDLVDAGANVNQRAIGSFFLPRDQQRVYPANVTDYEGLAYLGEYPLAWAACCANESVYNLLIDCDANPNLQDNFGNMILHMVVVCDKLDMFGYALRHPQLPAKNGITNAAGLTPLTLACKLGRADVFKEMLELSAKEFWRYSNITCSAYPLNALDTLLPDGRTNYNSAIFIILNGTKEEHLDMLDGGIIQRLLEEKWKTFARNQFLKRLLILAAHLICLSTAVYFRPEDPDDPLLGLSDDPVVITRYIAEIGTVLGVLSYVIFQQGEEIKNQGMWTFLKQQAHSPAKAIFLISNFLILACIPFRIIGDKGTEEAILLIALPGSWFLLMFFAGAVRLTGPFVTMIYSMITGDMLTFGIIYTIVLFGFSQSFYFLYKGFPGVKTSMYSSYSSTWMALFQITLGNYDYQELSLTSYPGISKAVFALFMVFVPILLLNMLIAMMGNTYAHVIEQSEKEWMKQWAKIVITLERAIPQADAHHYLQEYSISLGPSEDPRFEQRGVMVIKSKSKTRAKQRKGAVCNWKRVCKVTVNALKKKGMSGEQMRCLMWGRESINTPVKTKGPKVDPLLNPNGPNITEGFGGAMTAALDVLAITHNVDMNGAAQGLHLAEPVNNMKTAPNSKQPQKHLSKPAVEEYSISSAMNFITPDTTKFTATTSDARQSATCPQLSQLRNTLILDSTQLLPMQLPIETPNQSKIVDEPRLMPQQIQVIDKSDPLRELVNLESISDRTVLHELAQLATFVTDKTLEETTAPAIMLPPQAGVGAKNLVGIFAGTETFVKKVEVKCRKYVALDPSDSDNETKDAPLLGRVSRTRRAKSANLRYSAVNKKSNTNLSDKRQLFTNSSSSSNNSLTDAGKSTPPVEELDYAELRMRQVKESLTNDAYKLDQTSLRPINIDVAYGLINLRSSANEIADADKNKFDNTRKTKKRPKRPKTANKNRIGPMPPKDRPFKSEKNSVSEDDNFEDPLEPWSLKGVTNMNQILAWDNQNDSL